ncbi:hypothetical protein BG003_009275 [Podila horticola]|nr:hypothetical protein BG003_009275 [Podila horticola]
MRISAATALVATTLALLSSTPFSGAPTTVSARLTAQERLAVELLNPDNPNYCPACIKKAMSNHFPHACPPDLPEYNDPSRTSPRPNEMRCVCVAFHDLHWMRSDCSRECTFVRDERAMATFVKPSQMKGCEAFVNFETGEALEVEGMASKDEGHKPVVYEQDEEEVEAKEEAKEETKEEEEETVEVEEDETKPEQEEVKQEEVKAEEPKEEIKTEPKAEDARVEETKSQEVVKPDTHVEESKVAEEANVEEVKEETKEAKEEKENRDEAKEAKENRDEL